MRTLRRILTVATVTTLAGGLALANEIGYVDSQGVISFTTDSTYSLTLPDFNTDGGLYTLIGATLYFYGAETVSSFTILNNASSVQTFDLEVSSNLNHTPGNTANSADAFTGEVLDLFDTGIGPGLAQLPSPEKSITLGGNADPTCAFQSPTISCSLVAYVGQSPELTMLVQNIDPVYGFTAGTGVKGVDGVVKSITGADLANYTGIGTFNLTGGTKALDTFSGGGNNQQLAIASTASFEAEIDYTYSINSGTPEPATMALMGGALLGLGLIGKRFKKKS